MVIIINMAGDVLTLESLKLEVRKSFAKVYSALKARELQTIRQIDAIWQQCGNGTLLSLNTNCLQNIAISYANESNLFTEIHNFGLIDFGKLSIDSSIFVMEDYIDPHNDHMYSYKCLDDICNDQDSDDSLDETIHHEAIKQITQNNQCVCYVNISASEALKKFKDCKSTHTLENIHDDSSITSSDSSSETSREKDLGNKTICESETKDEILFVCDEREGTKVSFDLIKQLNPTQDWLNQILHETETEPSQIDFMEHTAIECS